MIVYNERGHRALDDDDIDVYPEDDVSSHRNTAKNNSRSSRSHTPIDTYPSSNSNSTRLSTAVIPDVTHVDPRTMDISKGYTPSITASTKAPSYRGSDGERTGSDSERKKDKERRLEDRDKALPGTPRGPSPIPKVGSTHSAIGSGEMLSANPPPVSSLRSPSIKPQSRVQSIYEGDGDHNSVHDSQRESHLWDNNPAPPISPRAAAFDAILDRPRSQTGNQSRSHTPYGGSRARTPALQEHPVSGMTRSNTPFIDRPKSGIESAFFDRPKSPFGTGSIYGDSGPAAMFGDSGPAADIGSGAGTSLFGDPPASVFGDAYAGENTGANDGWGPAGGEEAIDTWDPTQGEEVNDNAEAANNGAGPEGGYATEGGWSMPVDTGEVPAAAEGGAGDSWGTPVDTAEVPAAAEGGAGDSWSAPVETAEVPVVVTTSSIGKKGKNKGKNSTGISTPASGMASRVSPALSTKKSPFENTADAGFYCDPPISLSPAIDNGTGGLWGSKAPSPKPLSPLNPAVQIHDDPSTAVQNEFNWNFETPGDTGAAAGGETGASNEPTWNDVNLGDDPASRVPSQMASKVPSRVASKVPSRAASGVPSRVPSRVPSPTPPPPEEPAAVEKEPVTTGKGKKKKKGSATTTPAKSPHIPAQEVADKEEEERARVEREEQERLAAEAETGRLAAARLQEQQEEQERADKAERERIEQERVEHERLEQEKAAEAERVAEAEKRIEQERVESEKRAEAERTEHARIEQERVESERAAAAREKAEQEKAEQENAERERVRIESERAATHLEQEQKDKATTEPVSAFGFDPPSLSSGGLFSSSSLNPRDKPWMTDTGGGDDSWGAVGWGTTNMKKKKSKLGATSGGATPPSAFGSAWGFGAASAFGETNPAAMSPKYTSVPLGEELSSTQNQPNLFSFSSTTPNLDFGFGSSTQQRSRAASPLLDSAVNEAPPVPVPAPVGNEVDIVNPTAENDVPGEEEAPGFQVTVTSKSKKKKKKDKGSNNANDAGTGAETPVSPETPGGEEEPIAETPIDTPTDTPIETSATEAAQSGNDSKKKKKKKK